MNRWNGAEDKQCWTQGRILSFLRINAWKETNRSLKTRPQNIKPQWDVGPQAVTRPSDTPQPWRGRNQQLVPDNAYVPLLCPVTAINPQPGPCLSHCAPGARPGVITPPPYLCSISAPVSIYEHYYQEHGKNNLFRWRCSLFKVHALSMCNGDLVGEVLTLGTVWFR